MRLYSVAIVTHDITHKAQNPQIGNQLDEHMKFQPQRNFDHARVLVTKAPGKTYNIKTLAHNLHQVAQCDHPSTFHKKFGSC